MARHSPTLYLELRLEAGARLDLPDHCEELAVYAVSGQLQLDHCALPAGRMAVAAPGARLGIEAEQASVAMVIGGAPVGARHIWWNFVSSSKARIEQAKADWRAGRFVAVPGETEFIPLPD